MKKMLRLVVVAVALVAAAAGPSAAQELRFGAQASYGSFSEFGVGARAEMDLGHLVENLSVSTSLDYFFESDGTDHHTDAFSRVYAYDYETKLWALNVNAIYDLRMLDIPETFQVYVGGGLNYTNEKYDYPYSGLYYVGSYERRTDNDGFGLNVLAGCRFNLNLMVVPFVEVRYTLGGVEDQFITSVGVSYSLPR
ncbi:MAG TPA: outer membrane beta-barrel protein [bacterium]